MKMVLYYLYQPYKWLVFLPALAVCTVFFCMLGILLAVIVNPGFAGVAGFCWARALGLLTPMRVRVTGKENADRKRSFVVVANHQSHFDVLVAYGWLGMDIRWVMKKELRKVPALGIASEKLGHIFVDRSDGAAARKALQDAKGTITGGVSVLFFPEGTRSLTGEVGEFKKGAFFMAVELGLPILPVTIRGTRNILPPTSLKLFPGRAEMIIHEPVEVSPGDRDNIEALVSKVKSVIQSGLEK